MMNDAQKLSQYSVSELQQLVRQFPYFQTARKLLLHKLNTEGIDIFEQELKKSSVYIGDRAKLYFYLNANFPQGALQNDQSLPDLSLITTQQTNKDSNISISGGSHEDSTFNYLFLSEDEVDVINGEEKKEMIESGKYEAGDEMDLIDKFMSTGVGKIAPPKEDGPTVNLAKDSVKENPAILTETLARIYIKQKKYDKAIDIFNSLSLKFPEKSAYFADRIKELDILIKSS